MRTARRPVELFVGVLALAGCTAPAGDSAASASPELTSWVGSVCSGLQDVVDTTARQPDLRLPDLADAAREQADHLLAVRRSIDALAAEVEGLGPAPVDDGAAVAEDLRVAFTEGGETVGKAAAFVADAAPADVVEAVQATRTAQTGFVVSRELVAAVAEQPTLEDAFAAAPACGEVDSGPSDGG